MFTKGYRYFVGSYFQLIPLSIILQACIGSITIYFLLQGRPDFWDMVQLFICVAATTMYLGAILGQIHVKKVFRLFLWALFVNIIMLVLQLI
jgi:heme A synthase